jgi:hypothetical protein
VFARLTRILRDRQLREPVRRGNLQSDFRQRVTPYGESDWSTLAAMFLAGHIWNRSGEPPLSPESWRVESTHEQVVAL